MSARSALGPKHVSGVLVFTFCLLVHEGQPLATAQTAPFVAEGTVSKTRSRAREISSAKKTVLTKSYSNLPLSFEANCGIADERVKYYARGNDYGLLLTNSEAVFTLHSGNVGSAPRNDASGTKSGPIRLQIIGANPTVDIVGQDQLPGTVNYFLGNDPSKWRTRVASYGRVLYRGIYPGIDLAYYGNQRKLEFDFVVAPRSSETSIRLGIVGGKATVSKEGGLSIDTDRGTIVIRMPEVYQEVGRQRRRIPGRFRLVGPSVFGFTVGHYDRSRPLVIDPVLTYSTYLSGTAPASANAIAIDQTGSAYLAGSTSADDFPVTTGAFQTANKNPTYAGANVFITKFNPTGTALVYSTYLGGTNTGGLSGDVAYGIALDSSGDAFITGATGSLDFPVTPGAFQASNRAPTGTVGGPLHQYTNAFVTKLNPTGTALVYSTYLGGSDGLGDGASAIAVDSGGNAFVAGSASSSDFPVSAGAFQSTNRDFGSSGYNAFVTKLNTTGSALEYSTYLGGGNLGGNGDSAASIALDSTENAYITGATASTDFPITSGAFQTTLAGGYDAFVTKINPTGTDLVYSTYLGGNSTIAPPGFGGQDFGRSIAVDGSGSAYITGGTYSTDFPVTAGAFQKKNHQAGPALSNGFSLEAFVSKLNPSGTGLVYSTYLGGSGTSAFAAFITDDEGSGIAVDGMGNAYVVGTTQSVDFPVTPGALQIQNNGATESVANIFVTKINSAGTAALYSTYFGGNGVASSVSGDQANAVALDRLGNVFVTGLTFGDSTFPVTPGAFQTTWKGTSAFSTELTLGSTPTGYLGTTTILSASANPTLPGRNITFIASVTPDSGAGPLTGNLIFSLDDAVVATLTPNASGSATWSTSSLTVGSHVVRVKYSGDSTYLVSGTFAVEKIETILTPTVSVSPTVPSITTTQPLPVSVSVTGGSGNPTPTGTVTLTSGTFSSPTASLSGGVVTINVPAGSLAVGTDTVTVTYTPDSASSSTYTSVSGTSLVVVSKAVPVLQAAPSSSVITTTQNLTVMVSATGGSGNPTPTGAVALSGAGYSSPSTSLSSGDATINVPAGSLSSGSDTLTVTYTPDSASSSIYYGTSQTVSITVNKVSPSLTVTPSATNITTAESLTVAGIVSGGASNPPPTGTVVLSGGGYTAPAVTLSTSGFSITIPSNRLTVGTDTLTANYSGDSIYMAATGSASVTVTAAVLTPTITVTPGSTAVNSGTALSVTTTVTGNGATPTGTVTLSSGTYSSNAAPLSGGSYTFIIPPNSLSAGTAVLSVSYSGDSNYAAGGGTATVSVTQSVFSLAATTPAAASPGATVTSTVTVSTATGYAGTVTLACALTASPAGAAHLPTCSNGSAAVALSGSMTTGSATVTVSTTAPTTAMMRHDGGAGGSLMGAGGGAILALFVFLAVPARRRSLHLLIGMLVLWIALGSVSGCGGGGGGGGGTTIPGTTAGTYTFTVTGSGSPAVTPAPTGTFTFTVN